MAQEYYNYTVNRTTGQRFLDGEPATAAECNEAYFHGQISETHYNRRLRKPVTIRGRSIIREEDYEIDWQDLVPEC